MAVSAGSIMATIISAHIPRNEPAASSGPCPGIRIQAMDMVQPPGMGMPPSDIEAQRRMVPAALAAKPSPAAAQSPLSPVLVVAAHPVLCAVPLVPALRHQVEVVVRRVHQVDAA